MLNKTIELRDNVGYLQLSILIGQTWTSSGYFCSFIGHERTADILQSHQFNSMISVYNGHVVSHMRREITRI